MTRAIRATAAPPNRAYIILLIVLILAVAVIAGTLFGTAISEWKAIGKVEARAFTVCVVAGGEDCSAWADSVGEYPVASCAHLPEGELIACLAAAGAPSFRVGSDP